MRIAMSTHELKEFLSWCAILNYSILILWFGVFFFAHDWLYRLHGRWFKLSVEAFDAINYGGMAVYKIGVMLLNRFTRIERRHVGTDGVGA
jgi:hypothetical protein